MRKNWIITVSVILLTINLTSCRDENPVEQKPFAGDDILTTVNLTTIYSPEYQKNYPPGEELTIKWEPTPDVDKVTINLYKKREFRDRIVQDIPNSGEYVWKIPRGILPSHHYKLVIRDSDVMNRSTTSPVFFILGN